MSTIDEENKQKYASVASAPAEVIHEAVVLENVAGSADSLTGAPAADLDTMKIPDHFIRLGCLAFTCNNTEWPSCFGAKSSGTILCVEGGSLCFKPIEDKKDLFIFWSGNLELVVPRTCCKVYEQFFCFECFAALPSVEEGYARTPVALQSMLSRADGTQTMGDVVICQGGCCTIDSCNCKIPECLGCYEKSVFLCWEFEYIKWKMMCWDKHKANEDTLCIIRKGNFTCIKPYTLCKGISQRLCLDSRFACPCDDDVPCVYSMLPFCTCCVNGECNVTCCATINDVLMKGKMKAQMQAQYMGKPGAQAPPNGQMQVTTAQPV